MGMHARPYPSPFSPLRLTILLIALGSLVLVGFTSTDLLGGEITLGPIAGGVSDRQAVIFVRLSEPGPVSILYSADLFFRKDIRRSVEVQADRANDLIAQIPLTDLEPATTYTYRVLAGLRPRGIANTSRFTTAPAPDSLLDFDFAVLSDLSRMNLAAPAYASASAFSPAFVMQIGDLDHSNPGNFPRPVTVENWRRMHRRVLGESASGQDFANAIASTTPFFHIWDDHDYGADNADRTAVWKDLATQAFLEYFPLPARPNPAGGLWYSFRYAQAEIFVLDLRSQRDPNDADQGPEKSMLNGGRLTEGDQKTWLLGGLQASEARWKFIISSSGWNPNGKQIDSWAQYTDEQSEIVQFVRDHGVLGVIVISGDLHSGGGIDDGTNAYFPELSVPTTNIHRQRNCTGGDCGTWSEGILTGIDPSGFALIRVRHDQATGSDRVVLQVRGEDGGLRLEYVVALPTGS